MRCTIIIIIIIKKKSLVGKPKERNAAATTNVANQKGFSWRAPVTYGTRPASNCISESWVKQRRRFELLRCR